MVVSGEDGWNEGKEDKERVEVDKEMIVRSRNVGIDSEENMRWK